MSESVNPTGAEPDALSALRRRLEGRTADEQGRALTALVREQARDVLRTVLPDGPDAVEPGRPFRDLGFDSLAAVELHRRLTAATGLRPAGHPGLRPPDAAGGRRGCCGRCSAATSRPPRPPRRCAGPPTTTSRSRWSASAAATPGDSTSAEDLWRLVFEGRHVISDFPTDRGWDLDGLYDPDPGKPGQDATSATAASWTRDRVRRGLLRHQPARGDGDGPAAAAGAGDRLGGVGATPASTRRRCAAARPASSSAPSRRSTAPGCTRPRTGSTATCSPATRPAWSPAGVAYTFGLEGPTLTVDTACSGSLVALHLAVPGAAAAGSARSRSPAASR